MVELLARTVNNMDILNIKNQFPIFEHQPTVTYLDTGASSLTPRPVIDAVNKYYEQYPVNVHRGLYRLSEQATEECGKTRSAIADFLNAEPDEIVFTNGTTHAFNLLAYTLSPELKKGDNVVISILEHHANLVPWQQMAKKYGFELRFINVDPATYRLDIDHAQSIIDENTKIVSITTMSNVLGTIPPVKKILNLAKKVGAITILDAAQGIVHQKTDVRDLDCDFLAFGAHKLYGPTGVGALYGKKNRLEALEPFFFGGDMIAEVTRKDSQWNDVPYKFEAGTPPIAQICGFGAAITFVSGIGIDAIRKHEEGLTKYGIEQLKTIEGLDIIGPLSVENRGGVLSFTIDGIHVHDIADILGMNDIAVRAGSHCAMPLLQELGINGTVRASFGIYSTKQDVDRLIKGLQEVKNVFS